MKEQFLRKMALLLTIVILLVGATLVYADNTVADGDGVTPVGDSNLTFQGTVCSGSTASDSALVAIKRNGNAGSTNVFKNGSTVTISIVSVTGTGLSASLDNNTITLPTTWGSIGNNTMSDAVTSSVKLVAGTTFSGGSITYRATGMNSDGDTITRDDVMTVSATVESCNTNTPPQISVVGVTNNASYEIGSVPSATCEVTDAEDGSDSFAATVSAVTGPLAAYGLGEQTASCSYTDAGGLTASASVTYSIVDTTAPAITFVSRTTANGNGWNNGDVTVEWSCTDDPGSGVVAPSISQTLTDEGEGQSVTGTCEDHAGNTASNEQTGINIDLTAPTATASASPAANANGWNNTNVTVSFEGNDNLSGIASCETAVVLSAEAAGQSASGTCTDKAGNVSAAATATVNIDKTAPTVSLVGGPANGGTYYFSFVPAAPTCSASDDLSGLEGTCSVSGYSTAVGSHTVTATATDKAGNSASASATYEVKTWTLKGFYQPVDMNGTLNTVKNGSTVPLKFEVFAGPTELTDTAIVSAFAKQVTCNAGTEDTVEVVSTGATSLRYDATAGQFIYNWQTPKLAGKCYVVTMTTQDGSTLSANFKLK